MAPLIPSSLLLVANILVPIAILIFASGFFPYKPFLPGLAKYEALGVGEPPQAPFNKVVFMVVDALRSDFVYAEGSGFAFTQSLISDGRAIPFTAHATSPTITMPRIKAITTGSIPSFLDVILNFAESDTTSTLATQDTWLAQMKAKETGKLIMYGDDTWIKLFPESFDRADGTSSFFVADFTEVDNNVTRHIPEELVNNDWNTMILHFLGLDHIGHKSGPRSPNMIPKQREMDNIVHMIYQAMEVEKHLQTTLLVLCGDHGMNDAGNHGGSAPGETAPALVFISPKLKEISTGRTCPLPVNEDFQYYTTVEQSDIAPTLGALLGFPVPKNNLGAFIVDFLPFWPDRDDQVQILYRNAKQILDIVGATFKVAWFHDQAPQHCLESATDIEKLGCSWQVIKQNLTVVNNNPDSSVEAVLSDLAKWSKNAQEIMSSTASNYDMTKLVTGQMIAVIGILCASTSVAMSLKRSWTHAIPFFVITIAYGVMMFASSYVEEEQHFWYWAGSAWLAMLSSKSKFLSIDYVAVLVALLALRIARRWNQTGQKFAGEPDIARTFLPEHTDLLWWLVGASYLWTTLSVVVLRKGQAGLKRLATVLLSSGLMILAINFKVAFTKEDAPELLNDIAIAISEITAGQNLIRRARAVFMGILAFQTYTIVSDFRTVGHRLQQRTDTLHTLHSLLVLMLITQSRVSNIPLLLIFELQFHILKRLDLSLIEITTTSLLLQHASFFAFGGSNAISSVDLSSGYNGVSGYNAPAVGILTFVGNWAGPIFWTSATTILLVQLHQRGEKEVLLRHLSLLTFFVTFSLVSVMAACTVLRTHLFIWTVFSPKYLYSIGWSVGQHLVVNVGFGSLVFWFGTR